LRDPPFNPTGMLRRCRASAVSRCLRLKGLDDRLHRTDPGWDIGEAGPADLARYVRELWAIKPYTGCVL
jgi:hypothetical protein